MTTVSSKQILHSLRRLAGEAESAQPDGELLRRYLVQGDQSAFAALVRRHGAMVFAVCRSVLRQSQDAEDACQAVFLILARKGGSIRQSDGLGGWLQRVAYRVALKAQGNAIRRRAREAKAVPASLTVSSCDDLSWGELRAALHGELAALPELFRTALVLCYLEGLTQEEAARRLVCTPAAVKGRLQRGRDLLRRRLERRGVALTAALAAALTGQALAETAVPGLRHFTAETATTAAATLARGFLRPLVSLKLAVLSAVLLSAGLVAGGLGMRPPKPGGGEPPKSLPNEQATNQPTPRMAVDAHGDPLPDGAIARLGTMRFNHGDGLSALLFAADGKTIFSEGGGWLRIWDAATGQERGHFPSSSSASENQLALSPDGKTILALQQESAGFNDVVRVWDLGQKKEIRRLPLPVRRLEQSVFRRNALSPDGRLGAINLSTEMRIFDLTTGRELYKLAKGGKDVRDVVFAGRDLLVTADAQRTIDVWEARTGKLIRRFAHGAPAGFLSASADGRWLAVLEHHEHEPIGANQWSDKEAVHIWDLTAGTKKQALAARPKHRFRAAHFFAGGKRLLTSSRSQKGEELTVWDVETGERLREMPSGTHGSPPILAIRADGGRLVVGDRMGQFELWDPETGHRLSGEENRHAWAATVFLSPGGRFLSLGHSSLSTWDGQTGRRLDSFDLPRSYDWATPLRSFSPDGRYAVSFTGGGKEFQAILWDVAARRRLHTLRLPSQSDYVYVNDAFSPDSCLLATWQPDQEEVFAALSPDKESIVRIWDVRTGKQIRSFTDDKAGWPGQLSFSADGQTLLVAGKHVAGFRVADGKKLFSWKMKPLPDDSGMGMMVGGKVLDPNNRSPWRGLAVSPDATLLACTLDGGFGRQPVKDRIALFNARTGKLLRRWNDSGKPSRDYERLAFSPDGQLLASSDGLAIHLWEVATSKKIRTFHGHRGEINFLAFGGDGRRLASTSWDSTVLIWDLTGSPTERAVEKCWNDLAGDDAKAAHQAVWALARAPERSLPLLQDRLRPVKAVHREQIERWIKDLDRDEFAAREKAMKELEKLGELAEAALRRTLEGKPTLEQRRRIEPLVNKLESAIPTGEALRALRAVRVLEYAATPEARRLLRELASGAEDARLTRQAKAALMRLSRR